MTEIVTAKTLAEYEQFVMAQPEGSYLQSMQWARQNPEKRWKAIVCRNRYGRITGSIALLITQSRLPGIRTLEAVRGPVCPAWDEQTLGELLDAVKKLAKRERACFVRIDPAFPDGSGAFRKLAKSRRFRERRSHGEPICETGWVIDLSQKTLERTVQDLERTCAHELQIAAKRGVRIVSGGRELTEDFAMLNQQIAFRSGRIAESAEYFEGLLGNFHGESAIVLAYLENRPVSGALVIGRGKRCVVAFEADEGDRTLRARYPLRIEIVRQAMLGGCTVLEFPGAMAEGFREGGPFGGNEVVYAARTELVLNGFRKVLAGVDAFVRRSIDERMYFLRER